LLEVADPQNEFYSLSKMNAFFRFLSKNTPNLGWKVFVSRKTSTDFNNLTGFCPFATKSKNAFK